MLSNNVANSTLSNNVDLRMHSDDKSKVIYFSIDDRNFLAFFVFTNFFFPCRSLVPRNVKLVMFMLVSQNPPNHIHISQS